MLLVMNVAELVKSTLVVIGARPCSWARDSNVKQFLTGLRLLTGIHSRPFFDILSVDQHFIVVWPGNKM